MTRKSNGVEKKRLDPKWVAEQERLRKLAGSQFGVPRSNEVRLLLLRQERLREAAEKERREAHEDHETIEESSGK